MVVYHKFDALSRRQQKVTKREGMTVLLMLHQMLVSNITGQPSPSSAIDLKAQRFLGKLCTCSKNALRTNCKLFNLDHS
jgi:hypothetical protein